VDLMRRSSGHAICQPAAIAGEAAFARAGGRYGEARPGESRYTGSITESGRLRPAAGLLPDARGRGLPTAVAGAD